MALCAHRTPVPGGAAIHEVCDDEGDDGASLDKTTVNDTGLAAALAISVADAAKLLEPCSRPLEIAHDRACRAGFLVSCGLDGTEQWGRWLPQNRYSLDQVPCNMVEGDQRTYHPRGANEHVWVAGAGNGVEGNFQLRLRFVDGPEAHAAT
ncbi:hypothetical protein M885DRAFT_572767 [Pelagophyceae sp. CCMP2097]|nr:hypothetical protein M885DRAFT_572767 [Pelagophyceae sp. CCMP2097]